MEALYQSFMDIPVKAVSFEGLVLIVIVALVFIFKFVMPPPKKKDL